MTSTPRPKLPHHLRPPELPSPVSDPRNRWPAAAVLITICLCVTATLLFAEGDVRTAVLSILSVLGTAIGAALPSMFAKASTP